ncbi:hypothetical protein Ancab_002611 [Ancistrocladus abbreviatus]
MSTMDIENATVATGNAIAGTSNVAAPVLNPNAEAWNPETTRGTVEDRTLFVTYSNGFPLKEHQIRRFFNRRYGECVEYVDIPRRHRPKPPLFGNVTFVKRSIPLLVLQNQKEVEFIVNGRPLRCKKFRPGKAA